MPLIAPHGGKLVNRILTPDAARAATNTAGALVQLPLSAREAGDLEMMAIGAFSPLEGFMGEKDFARVCTDIGRRQDQLIHRPGRSFAA